MGELELGAAAEATVQAYKELAVDPTKCLALALDQTCIQFLAYVIAEGTGTLVQAAVDTLQLLAQNSECRPPLANTFGVLEALQEMADDSRYSEELRNQTASLFTCLQFSRHLQNKEKVKTPEHEAKFSPSDKKEEPSKDPVKVSQPESSKEGTPKLSSKFSITSQDSIDSSSSEKTGFSLITKAESKSKSEKTFLGPFNSKAKTITLFIEGMKTQQHRQCVEEELVRVRGLISIVFDLSKSRVTCRVKRDLSADKLAAAVSRTNHYVAQQIITGTDGEEIVVKVGAASRPNVVSPVEDLPEYLPEEETPVKETEGAVATSGSFKEAASSFISAAANLLQSSFYW